MKGWCGKENPLHGWWWDWVVNPTFQSNLSHTRVGRKELLWPLSQGQGSLRPMSVGWGRLSENLITTCERNFPHWSSDSHLIAGHLPNGHVVRNHKRKGISSLTILPIYVWKFITVHIGPLTFDPCHINLT